LDKKIFLDIRFLEPDKRGFLTYVGGCLRVKSEKGGWEDGNEVFVQKIQNPTSSEVGSVLLQLTIIVSNWNYLMYHLKSLIERGFSLI
jgi:hypothetical protein